LCREDGQALSVLASMKEMQGFELFGVIKETGVDDAGLLEFTKVFPFPLYRDANHTLYKALGNNKLSLMWLLYFMLFKRTEMKRLTDRMKSKELDGNFKGEGLLMGGVIVLDKSGEPRFSFVEKDSKELAPIQDIVAALNAIREEAK
jgi:hypothetical protein